MADLMGTFRDGAEFREQSRLLEHGLHLVDQGQPTEAVAHFRAVAHRWPHCVDAHFYLGTVLGRLGDRDAAVAALRSAIALNPGHAGAHMNLGTVLRDSGRRGEAVGAYRQAIIAEPENVEAYLRLAAVIGESDFTILDADTETLLLALIAHPNVGAAAIAPALWRAARAQPEVARLLEGKWRLGGAVDALARCRLTLALLQLEVVCDVDFERMLTELRRAMLGAAEAGPLPQGALAVGAALAAQCFLNEYVFYETEAEAAAVAHLQANVTAGLDDMTVDPALVALLGAYRPLHRLPGADRLTGRLWPAELAALIRLQVEEPLEELRIAEGIRTLTPIVDRTSQAVRGQYEENPFPRWTRINLPVHRRAPEALVSALPSRPEVTFGPGRVSVLVAGCGTGLHPIMTATEYRDVDVLAVDFSRASLAVAIRQTRAHGVTGIDYAQADILELGGIGRTFDVIEAVGVLHHLEDPVAGWRVLASLLQPKGVMYVALYSELGRRQLAPARAYIAERGYSATIADIRRFRRDILAHRPGHPLSACYFQQGFFTASHCRDLLFHVQEHRFTLPKIGATLDQLGLRFLGFSLPQSAIADEYRSNFPEDEAMTSLDNWNRLETRHPALFGRMYKFWVMKKDA